MSYYHSQYHSPIPAKPAVPIPALLPDIRYTAPEGIADSRLALSRLAPTATPVPPDTVKPVSFGSGVIFGLW